MGENAAVLKKVRSLWSKYKTFHHNRNTVDRHQLKQRPISQLTWPLQSVSIVQAGDTTIRSAELLALNMSTHTGFDSDQTRLRALMRLRDDSRSPAMSASYIQAEKEVVIQPAKFAPVEYSSQSTCARLTPSCSRRASIVGLPDTPIGNSIDGLFLRCLSRRPQKLCLINSVRH